MEARVTFKTSNEADTSEIFNVTGIGSDHIENICSEYAGMSKPQHNYWHIEFYRRFPEAPNLILKRLMVKGGFI